MTTPAKHLSKNSNDISGVMDEHERSAKVDRLNQISNSFEQRAGGSSIINGGMNSEISSMVEVSQNNLISFMSQTVRQIDRNTDGRYYAT